MPLKQSQIDKLKILWRLLEYYGSPVPFIYVSKRDAAALKNLSEYVIIEESGYSLTEKGVAIAQQKEE